MNFPIVGVTLCNNLRSLLGWQNDLALADIVTSRRAIDESDVEPLMGEVEESTQTTVTRPTYWTWARSAVVLPTLVLIFPVVVAFVTHDVEMLASAVGAYAGEALITRL